MTATDKLDQIEAEFLVMCPACDGGLPMGCACSPRDHRSTMNDLVAALRAVLDVAAEWQADAPHKVVGEAVHTDIHRAVESALGDS